MSGRSTGGGNNSKNTRPRSNRGRRGGGSNGDGRRDQRRDIIDEGRNYIPAPPKLSVPEIKQSQQETAIANFSSSELTYNGKKYVHAIFSTVYVNLDSFLYDKVIKMLETLVNRNSVKDNRVRVDTLLSRERYSFIPSSLGVFFLIIVRLLTELLRRVKEASVNETIRKGLIFKQNLGAKNLNVESDKSYYKELARRVDAERTYDPPGELSKYAPNFDDMNDEEDKKGKMMEEVNSTLDIKVENPPYTSAPGFQFDLSILCKNKCKLKLEVADESTHDRVIKNIVKYSNIGKLPNGTPYGLDETQAKALISSLTREIALIEGPPGTGKTVVGVQIMKVLLAKENRKTKIGPILTICFTNHALDQFLEHLVDENITKIVSYVSEDELPSWVLGTDDDGEFETVGKNNKQKRKDPFDEWIEGEDIRIINKRKRLLLNPPKSDKKNKKRPNKNIFDILREETGDSMDISDDGSQNVEERKKKTS
ncbi:unnamed protein product [Rhizophagus irregularis]|nr:unnamed protein product [Rhizophagus irregularis]